MTTASLRELILDQRPLLRDIVRQYGDQSLLQYTQSFFQERVVAPQPDRQQECISIIRDLAAERLGEGVAQEVAQQLFSSYAVSTADHHTSLFAPLAFQANALLTAAQAPRVVLSCACISLNHRDFPRGFQFHAVGPAGCVQQQLSIFPSKSQMYPVYGCTPFNLAHIVHLIEQLKTKLQYGDIPQVTAEQLQTIITQFYVTPDVISASDYASQITKINWAVWRSFMPGQLVYLEEETVVSRLLLRYHMTNTTPLHRLLFDASYQAIVLPQLSEAMARYLPQGSTGTTLFWGLSTNKHHRLALQLQGNALVSADGTISVTLTPSAIAAALENKIIFPNLLLTYTTLALYYQLNCLGGFNQLHYITAMQQIYNQIADDTVLSQANTQQLSYGLLSLQLQYQHQSVAATGLDLLLYGTQKSWPDYVEQLQQVKLSQAMELLWPECYRYLSAAQQAEFSEAELSAMRQSAVIASGLKPIIDCTPKIR